MRILIALSVVLSAPALAQLEILPAQTPQTADASLGCDQLQGELATALANPAVQTALQQGAVANVAPPAEEGKKRVAVSSRSSARQRAASALLWAAAVAPPRRWARRKPSAPPRERSGEPVATWVRPRKPRARSATWAGSQAAAATSSRPSARRLKSRARSGAGAVPPLALRTQPRRRARSADAAAVSTPSRCRRSRPSKSRTPGRKPSRTRRSARVPATCSNSGRQRIARGCRLALVPRRSRPFADRRPGRRKSAWRGESGLRRGVDVVHPVHFLGLLDDRYVEVHDHRLLTRAA